MNSRILSVAIEYLKPVLILASLFVLLRGHDEPGGGFVGGLIAASAFALEGIVNGRTKAASLLGLKPATAAAAGLLAAALSGLPQVLAGKPFLTAVAGYLPLLEIKLTTVLLFDTGVYLVVLGTALLIVEALTGEETA